MAARVWLVSIDFGGAAGGVLRVASDAVSVTDADGAARVFVGAVSGLVLREEMPDPGAVGEPQAASMTLAAVDVAAAIEDGHALGLSLIHI